MNTSNKYNGWTNYETWNVKLWLDNDQGTYDYMRALTQEAWTEHEDEKDIETRLADAVSTLREAIKTYIDEMAPDLGASMFADILGAALKEVDYREIAQAYIDDEIDEDARNPEVKDSDTVSTDHD